MPSRADAGQRKHDSSLVLIKATTGTKSVSDNPNRQRLRRTRFISGSTLEYSDCVVDDSGTPRTRRSNVSRHSKLSQHAHASFSSSPDSSILNPDLICRDALTNLVSSKDVGEDRLEAAEDENSFSSSVFSDKLVQPDLHLTNQTSRKDRDPADSVPDEIITTEGLLESESNDLCEDNISKESKADMQDLLIQAERVLLTPSAAADDAGSSEGEDESESREPALLQSDPLLHLCVDKHTEKMGSSAQPNHIPMSLADSCALITSATASPNNSEHSSTLTDKLPPASSPRLPSDIFCDSGSAKSALTASQVGSDVNADNWDEESFGNFPRPAASPIMDTENSDYHGCFFSASDRADDRTELIRSLHASSCDKTSQPHYSETPSSSICPNPLRTDPSSQVAHLNSLPDGVFKPVLNMVNFATDEHYLSTPVSTPHYTYMTRQSLDSNFVTTKKEPMDTSPMESIESTTVSSSDSNTPELRISVLSNIPRRINSCNNPGHQQVDDLTRLSQISSSIVTSDGEVKRHSYPLRSRLRQESMRLKWQAMQTAPKSFEQLPTEIIFRIIHYLSIQDVFRLQRLSRRFKFIIERYLLLVKRINFSNGFPFAFLPESITDVALKRTLSRTPEVTHILGFYPRRIECSYPSDCHYFGNRSTSGNSLTYVGIIEAFRLCTKLRSVELMDVELMSKLVHYLPRIKFHGMFRNRPDSWDCEYAVPLPPEPVVSNQSTSSSTIPQCPSNSSSLSASNDLRTRSVFGTPASSLFCSLTAAAALAMDRSKSKTFSKLPNQRQSNGKLSSPTTNLNSSFPFPNKLKQISDLSLLNVPVKYANLAHWFEPIGELPLGQGSPSTIPHFLPSRLFSAFSGGLNLISGHDNPNLNSIPFLLQDQSANALDALRSMAIAPFLQPGLPPIEAELIAVAPSNHSPRIFRGLGVDGAQARNNPGPVLAFAFGAIFIPPQAVDLGAPPPYHLPVPVPDNYRLVEARHYNALRAGRLNRGAQGFQYVPQVAAVAGANRFPNNNNNNQHLQQQQQQVFRPHANERNNRRQQFQRAQQQQPQPHRSNVGHMNASGPWLVSPLPDQTQWIGLPHAITNLTKLDLVSVAISAIPRLDNIKYLHLKWVVFASADPFFNFSAPKLQSFVMNNCCGPSRVVRFVRIFSALSRAPQLMRLELVATRFVDGLIGHIIDDNFYPGRGFRNLQRLVLSSNKDSSEIDVGFLLLAGQQTLNQVSIQVVHARNSLFEALSLANAEFPRLETLVLGYLDPYQSRLTVSELMSLGIGESSDHLMPISTITDWGMSLVFGLCPRLASITIRHAPYLHSLGRWLPTSINRNANADGVDLAERPMNIDSNEDGRVMADDNSTQECVGSDDSTGSYFQTLRCLTLENCPGIELEGLENALSTGKPFPCLEAIVLRDMFTSHAGGNQLHFSRPDLSATFGNWFEQVDWRKVSHLLSLTDLLAARRLSFSSLSPEGVGLASSVREVVHVGVSPGFPADQLRTKSFDLFYSLRSHSYLSSLLEIDGSCGPLATRRKRIFNLLFKTSPIRCHNANAMTDQDSIPSPSSDFRSCSTQTCLCGLLEWNVAVELCCDCPIHHPDQPTVSHPTKEHSTKSTSSPTDRVYPNLESASQDSSTRCMSSVFQHQQLGGPLAFHPFPPSTQHQTLCKLVTNSEWTKKLTTQSTVLDMSTGQIVQAVCGPGECPGCASDPDLFIQGLRPEHWISAPCAETTLVHRPRKWIARDACIDTSELRCHTYPKPLVFTINQPLSASFSNLTSLHFENVGITHLVLYEVPRLKNITLESCTQLRAILFRPQSTSSSSDTFNTYLPNPVPTLRRVRIINCPKFAIYNLLHGVSQLYPSHDENLSITYRPFGDYDGQVERVLWQYCQHAHVMISHDYKIDESERVMEEFHSTFDQLFREVVNFSDMLIRRDILSPNPQVGDVCTGSIYKKCEHGSGWDLITDIPWVHEVCYSLLKTGENRIDQDDQFYEILSEFQSTLGNLKVQRHGVHFHVQLRNVHKPAPYPASSLFASTKDDDGIQDPVTQIPPKQSYLNWPYSENYLATTHPANDLNAWGDGLGEDWFSAFQFRPPLSKTSESMTPNANLAPWQRLLLYQEEAQSEVEPEDESDPVQGCTSELLDNLSCSPKQATGSKRSYIKLADNFIRTSPRHNRLINVLAPKRTKLSQSSDDSNGISNPEPISPTSSSIVLRKRPISPPSASVFAQPQPKRPKTKHKKHS